MRLNINPLASSSEGNAYLIDDSKTKILIECGIPLSELQRLSGYFVAKVDGCLISHEHADHSSSVRGVMSLGVDCYMSKETAVSLNVLDSYRTNIIESEKPFKIGTFTVLPLKMNHDVYCLGFLIYSSITNEKLLFATDTYYIEWKISDLNYIMIEANYDKDILNQRILAGDTALPAKDRLLKSHMEIENAIKWLKGNDLSKVKRIYLMHLSGGSSSPDEFKRKVIEATGKPVTVCCR